MKFVWPALVLCCCLIPACTDAGALERQAQRLDITGSSTVAPLVAEIARRYESQNPGVRVNVQTGGSSRGIADARRGLAQIGMASRGLEGAEADLTAHTIARDGIGLIAHRDNPVGELSDLQVKAVFTGKITNWKELGGPDAPITVVNKAAGRSTLELFLDYYDLEARQISAHVVIGDNAQGIKTVAGNPHAIGYVSIGAAEYEARTGTGIKLLPMGGVPAGIRTVSEGAFPLARPLNLVTYGEVSGLARSFIEFAQSEQVHDLVKELYFVPVSP